MKIYEWSNLNREQRLNVLNRPVQENGDIYASVRKIVEDVKTKKDFAVVEYTQKFDSPGLIDLQTSAQEIAEAEKNVDKEILSAIYVAIERIAALHESQLPETSCIDSGDIYYARIAKPIQRVGLYVPGGTAPLIFTLMMLAIPAKIAGCPLRILCTPPNKEGKINPYLLVTAKLCGIQQIYKVGGAQAVAAMAYGTESIPKVDKIYGPGNAWVTQAKMMVAQDSQGSSIDMPAGPSELLVIADKSANPSFIAADLLSQAEHGPDSQVILVSDDLKIIESVKDELEQQIIKLDRKHIAESALEKSRFILAENLKIAVEISNLYAPEHLSLQVREPEALVAAINAAGAVFMGDWTPETLGDYVIGSNHVLPTYGYAKSFSGLSTLDFLTFINLQKTTKKGLKILGSAAMTIADLEGLSAHKNAVALRLKSKECVNE